MVAYVGDGEVAVKWLAVAAIWASVGAVGWDDPEGYAPVVAILAYFATVVVMHKDRP